MARLQTATCLAECARVFAEDRPRVAGVLQGAAYAAFRRASPASDGTRRPDTASVDPDANFLLAALRETGDIVAARRVDESLTVVIVGCQYTEGGAAPLVVVHTPHRFGCHHFRMGDDGGFPVGYHNLHPDVTLNFQLNRFWNWVGESQMLEELRRVAPSLRDYAEWTRELLTLGERALGQSRMLPGAYLIRAGAFFMSADDPRRRGARRTFLDTVLREFGVGADQHHDVAYFGRVLSAYRLTPASPPRGVIVVFGGFDSYIEEWLPMLLALRDAGQDVIAFDGPGQGAALEAGLPMTADWHKPVAAVLDHFGVDDVTLMGFSLGGCLVMRAAAFEPRVSRVIADDILTNFTACFAYRLAAPQKALIGNAHRLPAAVVDALINQARDRNMFADWGIGNAEYVFGVDTPAKALSAVRGMRTDDVSPRITQDVLLMAGAEDHYVPLGQLGAQIQRLTNARSVTARVFTRAESAQNHCQIGNLGLALRVILAWLGEVGG